MLNSGIISTVGAVGATSANSPISDAEVSESQRRQSVSQSGKESPVEEKPELTPQQMMEAVSSVAEFVQNSSRALEFQVDSSTGNSIITVLDSETDEVIRQVPLEEIVAIARFLAESAPDPVVGLLMDQKG